MIIADSTSAYGETLTAAAVPERRPCGSRPYAHLSNPIIDDCRLQSKAAAREAYVFLRFRGSGRRRSPRRGSPLLDRLDGLHEALGFAAYTSGTKSTLDVFFITAARALVFIALLYTTAPAVAVFARTHLIESVAETPYEEVPEWFTDWERTGLVRFDDLNGDGRIQLTGPASPVPNELDVDQDIMVLANPEIAGLPDWVVGLVAAGGLAAALSMAAGLLLVVSSAVSHDLLKRGLRPQITERGELIAARISAGAAVVVAGYLGIHPPGFVAQVVAFDFGLAASSFFPVILLGIFWERTTREGAILGMISGITLTASYIVWFKFVDPAASTPESWWFGISPEGIGTLGTALNFVVTIVVSRFTAPPPEEVRALVQRVRIPRRAAREISA